MLKCARGFLRVQVFFVVLNGFCGFFSCCNIHHSEGKFFTFLDIFLLESAASNVLKNANLITLTKSSTENDRNITTTAVAARWDDEKKGDAEVPGEKVWRVFF